MAATAGYQAGVETNQTQLSYGVEDAWGQMPAVFFQAIRYTSETLALTKTRQRPGEINITRQVSQAVTTQQAAGGTINYALSWGTYDDFFASLMQNDWTTPYIITSIGTDITLTTNGAGFNQLTSTLAGKFTAVQIGQWIRLSGFPVHPSYNTWAQVVVKPDNQTVQLAWPWGAATETSSGTNIQITGSTLNNGTLFKSLFIQQQFSPTKYLRYGGCYVTRVTLGASIGNFFTGAIDLIAQSEVQAAVNVSLTLPAPTSPVLDPISGWARITYPLSATTIFTSAIDQFSMTIENTGAAGEFSLGGAAGAIGVLGGTFTVSGSMRAYCADFNAYNQFQAEAPGTLVIVLQDKLKNSYVLSFQNVVLLCKIQVGGPGQAVYVQIDFEGNPNTVNGGTFQIDRHPPSV